MRLRFNAPVTFSFALAATLVLAIDRFAAAGFISAFFTAPGANFDPSSVAHYLGVLTFTLGHQDWSHLWNNFLVIILLGPILEEKYEPKAFGIMVAVTTLVAGTFNILLKQPPLVGSSALAFMMIMLVSFARSRPGEVPVSFLLVFILYLLSELTRLSTGDGQISTSAHIVGGLCGVLFGFMKIGQGSTPAAAPVGTDG